jgi:hypothetical protein
MRTYENECVDCGLPCRGNACPNRNVLRFYCDKCKEEAELYHYNDKELCIDCIAEQLEKVE